MPSKMALVGKACLRRDTRHRLAGREQSFRPRYAHVRQVGMRRKADSIAEDVGKSVGAEVDEVRKVGEGDVVRNVGVEIFPCARDGARFPAATEGPLRMATVPLDQIRETVEEQGFLLQARRGTLQGTM